ncbi:MAG: FHA domain-containing serine/threonine-protein kinase [Planctomycetota bacterium]
MPLRIRIEHGQDAGKTYRLATPGVYRIGRSPQGSFQVLDMKVSKDHFELHHDGTATQIRDLGSSHGTLLNGQRVDGVRPINPGDEIRVGLTVLRALSDGPGDADVKPVEPLPTGAATQTTTAATAANGGAAAPKAAGGKPAVNDPLVNTTLAGYRILQRVGAGGMGSVYRAEQLSLHREVALKVLAEKLVSDSAFVDQFVNEARAAGQLNHPNVVQVYDVGHADGRHYFSMEFIHGGSLEDKVPKTGGGVPFEEALPWFLDAANALIFAEKKGILHRDIKPDNFMVGQDGSVKLCDLGLAKKSESADLLAQGIIGTPHFIAPEAIRRKSDVDRRADLYSLGCTFFRILTGKNPFPAPSVKEILLAHLNQPVPRVSAAVPQLPKELDDVIAKLMAKDPAARFESATELWGALDKIRLQLGMEAHGLNPGKAKKLAIMGGVLALAAIGVAVYFITKPPPPKEVVYQPGETKLIGEDPAKVRELRADKAYSDIESSALKALGRHDDGENWKKPGWRDVTAQLREMAKEYEGTASATKATEYAAQIESFITKRTDSNKAYAAAVDRAVADLKKSANEAVAAAEGKRDDPLAAEAALDEGAKALKALFEKKYEDGRGLVAKAEYEGEVARLDALRASLASAVESAGETVRKAAGEAAAGGSAMALDKAIALLDAFVAAHPKAEGSGVVATAWNAAAAAVAGDRGALDVQRRKALRADYLADRGSAFEYLAKEAFAPVADDGSGGGLYRRFQFAEAADKAAARAKSARTPAYQGLFARYEAEARLAGRLPGALASGFAAKGFKDKVTGRGWSGLVKGFTAEGVQASDGKLHPFADEGLEWFVDLFFEKGAERYPLTADDQEGLAYVAVAAAVYDLEDAAEKFDVALAALDKAAALDASRADRLAARRKAIEQEKAIAALVRESDALVREVAKKLNDYGDLDPTKGTAASQKARNDVIAAEPDLRAKLATARARLDEAERGFLTTVQRAWLGDTVPAGAQYAGETLPTDDAPPAPAARPPAPAAPAMDGGTPPAPAGPKDGAAPGNTTPPGDGNPSVKDQPPAPGMADAPGTAGSGAAPGMAEPTPTGPQQPPAK